MADFIEYVVSELKSKRLSKESALSILNQFYRRGHGPREHGAPVLHPLLHENTSDLSQQSYSTRFSGEEFYLTDHRVVMGAGEAQKVLPAVVYLEMARAAIERASVEREAGSVLELRETVWSRPVVVQGRREVSIALLAQEGGGIEYEIYSEEEVLHCRGRAVFSSAVAVARLEVEQLRGRCAVERLEGEQLYERLQRMGLSYGAGHRAVEWLERGAAELWAQLKLPSSVERDAAQYVLHP